MHGRYAIAFIQAMHLARQPRKSWWGTKIEARSQANCPPSNNTSYRTMGRPKRNILAAATESTTPPDELTEHQFVARVGKPEGNNTYTCILPNTKTTLVELAQRFRNTIWIKRGGYVVVDLTPSEERSKTNNKVAGEIINVVRDEKEWRKMPYWYDFLRHFDAFSAFPQAGQRRCRFPLIAAKQF